MKKNSKNKILDPHLCSSEEAKYIREMLAKIGDKWSILLVVTIAKAPESRARFSELQRKIDGISQRMLTTTLRNLERDGLIIREVFPEVPPRVEYQLTKLGKSLLEPMQFFIDWICENLAEMQKAREKFDKYQTLNETQKNQPRSGRF